MAGMLLLLLVMLILLKVELRLHVLLARRCQAGIGSCGCGEEERIHTAAVVRWGLSLRLRGVGAGGQWSGDI